MVNSYDSIVFLQDELRELVTQCGGHVIGSPRRALIRVGRWVTVQYSLPAVKETWILGKTALQAVSFYCPLDISAS